MTSMTKRPATAIIGVSTVLTATARKRETSMLTLLRLSIGVVIGLMLWTAIAHGQGRPACDPQGSIEAKLREVPSC